MFDPRIAVIVGGAAAALVKVFGGDKEPPHFVNVGWRGEIRAPLTKDQLRELVAYYFCNDGGCRLSTETFRSQVFRRGNRSVTRLPMPHAVTWQDVPIRIQVSYREMGNATRMEFEFSAQDDMPFSIEGAEFFHEQSEKELDVIFEGMKEYGRRVVQEETARADARTSQEREQAVRAQVQLNDDLAVLGLKVGSSWSDVQGAYREACKKYHPDMLTGHNLPPHLVELAISRFKQIADAYQRLKGILGT